MLIIREGLLINKTVWTNWVLITELIVMLSLW